MISNKYRSLILLSQVSRTWRFAFLILLFVGLATCRNACGIDQATFPTAVEDIDEGPQELKILLSETGIYRLDSEFLKDAGIRVVSDISTKVRLFNRGNEQLIWVDGTGDDYRITFFGREPISDYSKENVYWLVVGENNGWELTGGDLLGEDDTQISEMQNSGLDANVPEDTYIAKIHLEENILYTPQVDQGDNWMWVNLPAPNNHSFEVNLDELAVSNSPESTALVRLALWSSTEAMNTSPDHHMIVRINDHIIEDIAWDGQGRQYFEIEFDASLLKEGENTILIEVPGDTGVAADINSLDWFELYYPRQLVAINDRISFVSPGGDLKIRGFSGPAKIFQISGPIYSSRLEEADYFEEEPSAISFQSEIGQAYYAVGPQGFLTPANWKLISNSPDLRDSGLRSEYVAIGPEDLLEAIQPLLDWREQNGLRVMAVPLDAIYDQFNFGMPEPQAIQNFIQYAYQNWEVTPRYVLLVGDATYDPLGYISTPEANRLPTFLVDTVHGGQTASDVEFTQVNDDPWPDLAVGRMPARNPEQIAPLIKKIISYEQKILDDGYEVSLLAIADGQEPHFRAEAQNFLDLFPPSIPQMLYDPPAGKMDANQEISQFFQEENSIVAYFGHGSINMWGKDHLFSSEDVAKLKTTSNFPIVYNLTCLTGLFTHPKVESLAESLLWRENGGAVGVLAPSSLTLPSDQSILSQAFVEEMLNDPDATLGEIHLRARRRMPTETDGALDVMKTFMLFGDPALKMPKQSQK